MGRTHRRRIGTPGNHYTGARPPLHSIGAGEALPAVLTTFIGREGEVASACARLLRPEVRLLTLTGTGGTGKTRLALEVARRAAPSFPDGVRYASLASLTEPTLVAGAVARVLGVRADGHRPMAEELRAVMEGRRVLLVLDNCEHLLSAMPLVSRLLAACPGLKALATSRAPLRVSGEHEHPVPPMTLPLTFPPAAVLSPTPGGASSDGAEAEALQLFVARAREARPGFDPSGVEAGLVVDVCRSLDGLPLAIELAAARIRHLPLAALSAQLATRRLAVLTSGPRDAPARQHTLRNTIAWSHDLLSIGERALFRRLAAFSGSCSAAAAGVVCRPFRQPNETGVAAEGALSALSDSPLFEGQGTLVEDESTGGPEVLDGLGALVDQGLLLLLPVEESEGGAPRFRMLETVREFATERLEASGECAAVRRLHAQHFLTLAEAVAPELLGAHPAPALDRLQREQANVQGALQWSLDTGELEVGLRLAVAVGEFWYLRGHLAEGRSWLSTLLAPPAGTPGDGAAAVGPSIRMRAQQLAGRLAWQQADYTAAGAHYEASLALARHLDERAAIAGALGGLGSVARARGDLATASALYAERLALQRTLGSVAGVADGLDTLGAVAVACGDWGSARARFEESLGLWREVGDQGGIMFARVWLGRIAAAAGDDAAAGAVFAEVLAVSRAQGFTVNLAYTLPDLADVATRAGDFGAARDYLAESCALFRSLDNRTGLAVALDAFARLAVAEQRPATALRLAGAAAALREAVGSIPSSGEQEAMQRLLHRARRALGNTAAAAAAAEGRSMTLEAVIAGALAPALDAQSASTAASTTATTDGRQRGDGPRAIGGIRLTPRERQVVQLLARGSTNREIAGELVIAERTADTHVANVLNKLGVTSRAQVAAWAVRHGLTTGAT